MMFDPFFVEDAPQNICNVQDVTVNKKIIKHKVFIIGDFLARRLVTHRKHARQTDKCQLQGTVVRAFVSYFVYKRKNSEYL